MNLREPDRARVIQLRPGVLPSGKPSAAPSEAAPASSGAGREPLWRDVVGEVLRRERLAQERTLKDVAEAARISMPYLSEVERGRKEASSEVLAAAARSLGLGLADLLAMAQDELARLAQVRARKMRAAGLVRGSIAGSAARSVSGSAVGSNAGLSAGPRRTEMCLAA